MSVESLCVEFSELSNRGLGFVRNCQEVYKKSNNDFLHGSNLIPKRVRLTPMFATSSAILKHLEAF